MNSDQRLIKAQGEQISKLNDEIRELREALRKERSAQQIDGPPARAWRLMVEQVRKNEYLQHEFDRFLIALKLAADETYLDQSGAYDTETSKSEIFK